MVIVTLRKNASTESIKKAQNEIREAVRKTSETHYLQIGDVIRWGCRSYSGLLVWSWGFGKSMIDSSLSGQEEYLDAKSAEGNAS